MASDKDYLQFILEKLSALNGITYRPMMGEYLLYANGKPVGGIYDNRLLIKPLPAALSYLKDAKYASPYPGAKEMLLVENVDDAAYLTGLFSALLS